MPCGLGSYTEGLSAELAVGERCVLFSILRELDTWEVFES